MTLPWPIAEPGNELVFAIAEILKLAKQLDGVSDLLLVVKRQVFVECWSFDRETEAQKLAPFPLDAPFYRQPLSLHFFHFII